ncbi:MAG: ATP-dependent DNA ligase [Candidatus Bathyarchaeota archaeon BA2]|nr:MAG: ATP-dependent DNA ligase [Candidatus Bathyarchaeota archaeon BA2]
MRLKEYWKKRDFEKTNEPKGGEKTSGGNIYVIQKHQARRLHYDLRLEMDGVLRSWAIPKTPPTEKGIKRLAVQVGDHPVDYANFEGCFEFYTKIITDKGAVNIGEIVNKKLRANVLSYNLTTDQLEWKPIVGWFRNGRTKDFIRIRVPGQHGGRRIITVTPNHMIYTPTGLKPAGALKVGDTILVLGMRWGDEQIQILLGTILGDAHLEQPSNTHVPHYELTHAGGQKGYLEFVRNQLAPKARIRARKGSDSYSFRFTDVSLLDLYQRFYNEGKKAMTKEILSMLDERGLAVWYMDDGYLAQSKYVELCTHGFTKEENNLIADFLNDEWQLEAKVYHKKPRKKSAGGYFIHLSKVGSMRFLTLINNFILKELRYKTYIRRYHSEWMGERGEQNVVPARIVALEKASSKQIRSQQRYDIHVQDNNNYFAGSMLVSNSIPEGLYGAGTVEIWDNGQYVLKERDEDKLIFEIKGNKLRGIYCLVRFKGRKNWLFFKKK